MSKATAKLEANIPITAMRKFEIIKMTEASFTFIAIPPNASKTDGSTTLTAVSSNRSARITQSAYVQYTPKLIPTTRCTTRAPFSFPTKPSNVSTNIHQSASTAKALGNITSESRGKPLIKSINVVPTTSITILKTTSATNVRISSTENALILSTVRQQSRYKNKIPVILTTKTPYSKTPFTSVSISSSVSIMKYSYKSTTIVPTKSMPERSNTPITIPGTSFILNFWTVSTAKTPHVSTSRTLIPYKTKRSVVIATKAQYTLTSLSKTKAAFKVSLASIAIPLLSSRTKISTNSTKMPPSTTNPGTVTITEPRPASTTKVSPTVTANTSFLSTVRRPTESIAKRLPYSFATIFQSSYTIKAQFTSVTIRSLSSTTKSMNISVTLRNESKPRASATPVATPGGESRKKVQITSTTNGPFLSTVRLRSKYKTETPTTLKTKPLHSSGAIFQTTFTVNIPITSAAIPSSAFPIKTLKISSVIPSSKSKQEASSVPISVSWHASKTKTKSTATVNTSTSTKMRLSTTFKTKSLAKLTTKDPYLTAALFQTSSTMKTQFTSLTINSIFSTIKTIDISTVIQPTKSIPEFSTTPITKLATVSTKDDKIISTLSTLKSQSKYKTGTPAILTTKPLYSSQAMFQTSSTVKVPFTSVAIPSSPTASKKSSAILSTKSKQEASSVAITAPVPLSTTKVRSTARANTSFSSTIRAPTSSKTKSAAQPTTKLSYSITTMFESTLSIIPQSTLITIHSLFSTTKALNKSTVTLPTETKTEASTAPIPIPGTISTKNIENTSTLKSPLSSTMRLQSIYKTETPSIRTTKFLYSSKAMFQTKSTVNLPITSLAIPSSVSPIKSLKISSVILSSKSEQEASSIPIPVSGPASTTKVKSTVTVNTLLSSTMRLSTTSKIKSLAKLTTKDPYLTTAVFQTSSTIKTQFKSLIRHSTFSTIKAIDISTVIQPTESIPEFPTTPITILGTISTKNAKITSTLNSPYLSTVKSQSKYKTETPVTLTTKTLYSSQAMFQTSSTVKVPFTSVAIPSSPSASKKSSVILSTKSKQEASFVTITAPVSLSTAKVRSTARANTSFSSTIRAPTSSKTKSAAQPATKFSYSITTMFESTLSIIPQSTLITIHSLFSTTKALNKSTVTLPTETKTRASTAPIPIPGIISTKNIESTSIVKGPFLSTMRLQSIYKTETPSILATKSLYSSETMFQTTSIVKVPFISLTIPSSVTTTKSSKKLSVTLPTRSRQEAGTVSITVPGPAPTSKVQSAATGYTSLLPTTRPSTTSRAEFPAKLTTKLPYSMAIRFQSTHTTSGPFRSIAMVSSSSPTKTSKASLVIVATNSKLEISTTAITILGAASTVKVQSASTTNSRFLSYVVPPTTYKTKTAAIITKKPSFSLITIFRITNTAKVPFASTTKMSTASSSKVLRTSTTSLSSRNVTQASTTPAKEFITPSVTNILSASLVMIPDESKIKASRTGLIKPTFTSISLYQSKFTTTSLNSSTKKYSAPFTTNVWTKSSLKILAISTKIPISAILSSKPLIKLTKKAENRATTEAIFTSRISNSFVVTRILSTVSATKTLTTSMKNIQTNSKMKTSTTALKILTTAIQTTATTARTGKPATRKHKSIAPTTNPATANATSSTTYQPPAEFCINKVNGNNPDPTRCDGFIACVHGRAIFMKCPAELRYNPFLGQCDWKYNVECSKCKYLIFWAAFVLLVLHNLPLHFAKNV